MACDLRSMLSVLSSLRHSSMHCAMNLGCPGKRTQEEQEQDEGSKVRERNRGQPGPNPGSQGPRTPAAAVAHVPRRPGSIIHHQPHPQRARGTRELGRSASSQTWPSSNCAQRTHATRVRRSRRGDCVRHAGRVHWRAREGGDGRRRSHGQRAPCERATAATAMKVTGAQWPPRVPGRPRTRACYPCTTKKKKNNYKSHPSGG